MLLLYFIIGLGLFAWMFGADKALGSVVLGILFSVWLYEMTFASIVGMTVVSALFITPQLGIAALVGGLIGGAIGGR